MNENLGFSLLQVAIGIPPGGVPQPLHPLNELLGALLRHDDGLRDGGDARGAAAHHEGLLGDDELLINLKHMFFFLIYIIPYDLT